MADDTKKVDVRLNPLCQDEDFFIPLREGTRPYPVAALREDVEYFRMRLAAALKVPVDMLYPPEPDPDQD